MYGQIIFMLLLKNYQVTGHYMRCKIYRKVVSK